MSDAALDLDALQRAVDGLRSQQESVRRERAELQSMKAVVDANLARFKQRVKLNVGGSKFETTLSTLTRYPDSMLGAMFSGRHEVPPDDEGYVFIDRDGTHFRAILNFLRTGFVDQPRSEQAANELKRELEYYQLPSEGLLSPPRTTSARTVEIVCTTSPSVCTSAGGGSLFGGAPAAFGGAPAAGGGGLFGGADGGGMFDGHKRDVEAKLKANPQLKIISNHAYAYGFKDEQHSFTTVLATVDACVSTVAGIAGSASDFAD